MKKIIGVILILASINVSASGIPTVDVVGNLQRILQYVEDAAQTLGQFQQIEHQVNGLRNQTRQIENQLKTLKNLNSYNWQDYLNIINQLDTIAKKADALAFSTANLGGEYDKYRDQAYYEANADFYNRQQAAQTRWSANASGTIKSSAAVLSAQHNDLKADGTRLNQLQNASSGVDGEVQAMQAGNQLAAFTSKQMMQVRNLLMNQQQMDIQERAQKAEKEALQAAASRKFLEMNTAPSTSTGF